MLGSLEEAKDVVQETYLKWHEVNSLEVKSARAWLITTCSRLAINSLNSARVKRERYYGLWLPEPYIESIDLDLSCQLEIDESVSTALLMTLERLSPLERAAYILREFFGFNFDEISNTLDKSNDSCRQLVSRARKNIQNKEARFETSSNEHKQLLKSFVSAARAGDINQFERILSDSVELYADGGGKAQAINQILNSPTVIGKFFIGIWKEYLISNTRINVVIIWYNGCPGILIYENKNLATAINFDVKDNKINKIYAMRNPDKLKFFIGQRFGLNE